MFNNNNRKGNLKLFSSNPVKAALTIIFLGSMYSLVKASGFVERGINKTKLIENTKEEGK